MRRLPLLLVSLIAAIALFASACGDDSSTDAGARDQDDDTGDNEPSDSSLDGAWILIDSVIDGEPLELLTDYAVTMNIEGAELGGRAACNSYGGNVTIDGAQFRSADIFQTEMGCEEPAMSLEFDYLSALARVDSWTRNGDVAQLTGEGVLLTFEIVPPPPTADLVETSWVLDTIIQGESASSTINGADDATLALTADGTLTGSTGCRTFTGEFVETGGTITITNLTMEGDCDASFVWQDNSVVSVIEGEVTVTIDGSHLTLMAAGGEGLRYTTG